MFISKEDAYAKLDGAVGQAILDGLTVLNLKGLAFFESGFRHLTNNRSAVATPDQLRNYKIRVMQNDVHIAAWRAWGANPTPMAFPELFTALQQGTVDGEECPLGIIHANKFHEVQKYLSLTGHSYTAFITIMNLDLWNKMNKKQQDIVVQSIKEATDYERERSTYYEDIILQSIKDYGTTVIDPTIEQKQIWKDTIMQSGIYDTIRKQMTHPDYLTELIK
jgi:tripartite ATP-independent transporter DctP family solute receptor